MAGASEKWVKTAASSKTEKYDRMNGESSFFFI